MIHLKMLNGHYACSSLLINGSFNDFYPYKKEQQELLYKALYNESKKKILVVDRYDPVSYFAYVFCYTNTSYSEVNTWMQELGFKPISKTFKYNSKSQTSVNLLFMDAKKFCKKLEEINTCVD